MEKKEPMLVADIIRQAFIRAGRSEEFERQRVCSLWPEVVGPTINRQTVRRWISDTTLHVCIASPLLRNDLSFMQQKLIDSLNALAGKQLITKIVFH